jgi:hypothetical protein
MIRVFCACGRAFKAEDRHAGKRTKCPECGTDLTIGPAPKPSSSGGDVNDAPAWWYPKDAAGGETRGMAPTQSGSDPGPDAINTMVLPAGYDSRAKPHVSSQSPPAAGAAAPKAQGPPRARIKLLAQLPARWSLPATKVWAFAGGTIALLVLTVGAILWLRSATPGVEEAAVARRGPELEKPGDSGPSKASPTSVTDRNPNASAQGSAKAPTSDGAKGDSPTATHVDVAGQLKAGPAGASHRLRLLVPAYIYPGGDGRKEWQRLIDAASKVEIVAIANPNSGPGEERNLDYAAVFTEAGNQGIKLVGYVSTDYGKRADTEIKNDVDTWLRFYPQIRGFFFDQQPRESRHAVHFAELRDYAKGKLRDALVITNPGVPCDQAYLDQAVSNVTCIFVNYQGFPQFELPATLQAFDPARFAAMPYDIADAETMRSVVKDAIIKRIGYLYISDAKPPNQWGKLPVYWEAEVDAVSRVR